jgi:hypothetical protein
MNQVFALTLNPTLLAVVLLVQALIMIGVTAWINHEIGERIKAEFATKLLDYKATLDHKLEDYKSSQKAHNDRILEDYKAVVKEQLDKKLEDYKGVLREELDKKLEDYRSQIRRHEQAVQIAGLLARLTSNVPKTMTPVGFTEKVWEMSLWLPPALVRDMTEYLCNGANAKSPKELLIAVRKIIHGPEDDLTANQIVHLNLSGQIR